MDFLGGIVGRAVSLRATDRQDAAVALAHLLAMAAREIEAAIGHIRDGDEVLAHCRAIKWAEEEGDAVWETAVTGLFTDNANPLELLRWKAVYDPLEDALDACEDVANELETITVKHA